MHSSRFPTLAAVIFALAACGPLYGQASDQPLTGDDVLRSHGHGIHATRAPAAQPGTVAVVAPNQDSLDAANRARADSVERARLAALAANGARADSLEQASAALRAELAGLIHFEFDRSGIQPTDRAALDRKAAILTANPAVRVRIAGYCDERGSDGYNLALGTRRAAAAKQYLIERGIDAGRLDVVSFGSGSPVDSNLNEAAWALNRRAEFEVASGGDALRAPVALR
jgi:peptidoglycan-associated lipoprotein